MTDRKQALTDLLEKVEAGTWPGANVLHEMSDIHGWHAHKAFQGSLDAAKALHEAVLPEWGADLEIPVNYAHVHKVVRHGGFEAMSSNAARAWLIAILKALIAKEDA